MTTSTRHRSLGLGLFGGLFLLALSACDLEFPEQEVHVRHNPSTNTLDLLFLCKGVTIPKDGDEELQKGVAAVQRLLNGHREFMVINWPFHVDFDGVVEDAREDLEKAQMEHGADLQEAGTSIRIAQMFLAVEDQVQVTDAGLFLDERGRLCGYQKVQVQRVDEFLRFLNETIRMGVLEDAEDGMDDEFFDDQTRQMWIDKARGPTPWLDLVEGRIEINIPMSNASARGVKLKAIEAIHEAKDDDTWVVSVLAQVLASAREIRFDERGMHIALSDPSGTIRLDPTNPNLEYSSVLLDGLVLQGTMPDTSMNLERARALMR